MGENYILAAVITSVCSLIGVGWVAWFQYHGSERASQRTQEVQEQTHEVALFTALTQEQRADLTAARDDARAAREQAAAAHLDADRSRQVAEDCHDTLQRVEYAMERNDRKHQDLIDYALTLQGLVQSLGGTVPDVPRSLHPLRRR
jgi:biopolymer transport protein ExbB/TolQ